MTVRIPSKYHLLLAGLMLMGVGVMLSALAWHWEEEAAAVILVPLTAGSLILGFIIHRYGFSKIATKNINRIGSLKPRTCLFAFMPLRSYLIIIVMMAMGYGLRHSPLPHLYIVPVYLGIGSALFMSGLLYLRSFGKTLATNGC